MAIKTRQIIMYRDSNSGPWHSVWVDLDLVAFTKAKNPDKYIKSLVEISTMGVNIREVSYKLTLDAAKKIIKNHQKR